MEALQNTLALIVTLGLLVTVHEFGHFWVARRCGVKVLRFSVGFGAPLVRWSDRSGTEFVIAAIPLGGYVKMLDEREETVPAEWLEHAYNRQGVWRRIAIAAAGPLANFIFAFLAYWIMFVAGTEVVVPVVGSIVEDSPAQRAGVSPGDEILAVDGRAVNGWGDVSFALVDRLGDEGNIVLSCRREGWVDPVVLTLPVVDFLSGAVEPDPLRELGIEPWRPPLPALLQEVVPESRADQAGLRPGDRVLAVENTPISTWQEFVEWVRQAPEQALRLRVQRDGQELELVLVPAARIPEEGVAVAGRAGEQSGLEGFAGVSVAPTPWPADMKRELRHAPLDALWPALTRTGEMSLVILDSLKKLVMGIISVENLGGPITIAKAAGASASVGLESFLTFLAQLSVMLGVLNLLPIPMLDGGHLLFYFVEAVRGRPLSDRFQMAGIKIGMAILAAVMALALFNDFSRL